MHGNIGKGREAVGGAERAHAGPTLLLIFAVLRTHLLSEAVRASTHPPAIGRSALVGEDRGGVR
jgi:hypothetical protein